MMQERFADALRAQGMRAIDATDYVPLFKKTFPEEGGEGDGGMKRCRALLDDMKAAGLIRFPAKGSTVSFGPKQFPATISVVGEKRDEFVRPSVEWDARLAGAGSRSTSKSLPDLLAMNAFLKRMKSETVPLAPVNARSLEIFGDEKTLKKRALRTSGDGLPEPLTLADFNCYIPNEYYLPYAVFPVLSNTALIVENAETFHVMKMRNRIDGRYRAVVYGQGMAIKAGYLCLPEIAQETGVEWFQYFGDVDVAGFQMPIAADRSLGAISPFRLVPAVDLYRECLSRASSADTDYSSLYDAQKAWAAVRSDVVEWFSGWPDGFEQIEAILKEGRRVAQEWVY